MDQDDTVKLTELPTGQDSSAGDAYALRSSSAAPQMALVLQYFPFFLPPWFRVSPEFEIRLVISHFSSSCFAQWGTDAFESFKLIMKREEKQRREMAMPCK